MIRQSTLHFIVERRVPKSTWPPQIIRSLSARFIRSATDFVVSGQSPTNSDPSHAGSGFRRRVDLGKITSYAGRSAGGLFFV